MNDAPLDTGDPVPAEQRVLDDLYRLLADEIQQISDALHTAVTDEIGSTPAARVDREALVRSHSRRLAQLQAAQQRLCFGRIDRAGGGSFHLGRVGLAQPGTGARALLDWRAPAAAAFYQATGANPMGLRRRRHLHTEARVVRQVVDELLDLGSASPVDHAALDSNSVLLAALNAPRDGRMHEVVATIQAEQDRIIRAPLAGALVVQGAPGTGKTVVALHRAAYLLYTHAERLRSGVLVVGPGAAFLGYIAQVLPSLGESGTSMVSLAQLHPGVAVTAADPPAAAALKGGMRMAGVLRRAVDALPRVPQSPVALDVDGDTVLLRPADVVAAMRRAQGERLPHNGARITFVREILERLLRGLARATGFAAEDVTGSTRTELLRALHASRDVRREVNRCWPLTTPEQLLRRLYRNADVLTAVAPDLSTVERQLLSRPDAGTQSWTVADVALLDETAEILGEDPEPRRRAAALRAAGRADESRYAAGVAELTGAGGVIDADRLAARYSGDGRDAADDGDSFDWDGPAVFGHVVVDEAQDLSAMQWRAVLRRCPTRSLTVVGDIAQATTPGAASSWSAALTPHLGERWDTVELSVNYRLPRAINDLAHAVLLATGGAETSPARAVREGTDPVRLWPAAQGDVDRQVSEVVAAEHDDGVGTVAVITTAARVDTLREQLDAGPQPRLSVLTAVAAKGLEFDAVVVVVPLEILAEVGPRALYVALTRATQRLHVIGELPTGLGASTPS